MNENIQTELKLKRKTHDKNQDQQKKIIKKIIGSVIGRGEIKSDGRTKNERTTFK